MMKEPERRPHRHYYLLVRDASPEADDFCARMMPPPVLLVVAAILFLFQQIRLPPRRCTETPRHGLGTGAAVHFRPLGVAATRGCAILRRGGPPRGDSRADGGQAEGPVRIALQLVLWSSWA